VNNVCFMAQADYQAHEIRLCIHQGRVIQDKTRAQSHSKEQYFKSAIQMHEVFSDAKQVLENTNILAKRCNVTLSMGKVYLPEVAAVSDKDFFLQESLRGLERRFSVMAEPPKDKQLYYDRMQREVETITKMGFSSYFLIVADFIKWSKLNQVPVGPGRGSGAGSLVSYALEITDIDP
jgi:DNA polymerase-3 subunit alpha